MTDVLRLKLIFILCSITTQRDRERLKEFVQVCSYHVTDSDFNKIMRKSLKILEFQNCGSESYPDWLMNNLFDLYKSTEED